MKTYTVTASQVIYYTKTIEANSPEEAEELAWETDTGHDWKEVEYGDWQIEQIEPR